MKVNFIKLRELKLKYGRSNISLEKALFLEKKEASPTDTSKLQKYGIEKNIFAKITM